MNPVRPLGETTLRNKLFLVEDDHAVARVLSSDLRSCGYDVECAANGDRLIERLELFRPDLVLLDVMLPGKSGFELCSLIRRRRNVPVIMVTARDGKLDKLKGLEMGADDYITKPFDFDEFRARIRAVLRRARLDISCLRLGDLVIDFGKMSLSGADEGVHLTAREFSILSYLAERKGTVVSRSELLREIWGYPDEPRTRAVDYAIKRLREKIETDPHRPRFLQSVRGDGYCLTFDEVGW
jgi:two-component system response regulator VicR